jgi:N-acetyl-gamma-glutamyl-phosphate reductase
MTRKRVGIVGVSGYGGGELLRLCLGHPDLGLSYVAGESTAGRTLAQPFPALAGWPEAGLTIEPFDPDRVADLDLLFVSLPTGKSRDLVSRVSQAAPGLRIVDVGGDHRHVDGWDYGLTELPGLRQRIRSSMRVANPGCYPAASLLALAPLVHAGLVDPLGIVVDAKSGVTGTGRGGASAFGFVDTNEDLFAYGLDTHPHVPEMERALSAVGGQPVSVRFTPHLVPMTRGILATCYARARPGLRPEQPAEAASALYRDEPFVRVVPPDHGRSPHTRWARASNLAFVSYAVCPRTGWVIAVGVIDNLGKGAAAQAVQNANLMLGLAETAGLGAAPVWM